jgi:hypothetical protein
MLHMPPITKQDALRLIETMGIARLLNMARQMVMTGLHYNEGCDHRLMMRTAVFEAASDQVHG